MEAFGVRKFSIVWVTLQIMVISIDSYALDAPVRLHPSQNAECHFGSTRIKDPSTFSTSKRTTDVENTMPLIEIKVVMHACKNSDSVDADHEAMPTCNPKVTIKLEMNNIGKTNTEEEFFVVGHTLDALTMQRTRLNNPYVIKIRQEPVLQLYGLRFDGLVNAEAREEVVNRDQPNFKGCNDALGDATCGVITENGKPVPFSQGFCCSCDDAASRTTNIPRSSPSTTTETNEFSTSAIVRDAIFGEAPTKGKIEPYIDAVREEALKEGTNSDISRDEIVLLEDRADKKHENLDRFAEQENFMARSAELKTSQEAKEAKGNGDERSDTSERRKSEFYLSDSNAIYGPLNERKNVDSVKNRTFSYSVLTPQRSEQLESKRNSTFGEKSVKASPRNRYMQFGGKRKDVLTSQSNDARNSEARKLKIRESDLRVAQEFRKNFTADGVSGIDTERSVNFLDKEARNRSNSSGNEIFSLLSHLLQSDGQSRYAAKAKASNRYLRRLLSNEDYDLEYPKSSAEMKNNRERRKANKKAPLIDSKRKKTRKINKSLAAKGRLKNLEKRGYDNRFDNFDYLGPSGKRDAYSFATAEPYNRQKLQDFGGNYANNYPIEIAQAAGLYNDDYDCDRVPSSASSPAPLFTEEREFSTEGDYNDEIDILVNGNIHVEGGIDGKPISIAFVEVPDTRGTGNINESNESKRSRKFNEGRTAGDKEKEVIDPSGNNIMGNSQSAGASVESRGRTPREKFYEAIYRLKELQKIRRAKIEKRSMNSEEYADKSFLDESQRLKVQEKKSSDNEKKSRQVEEDEDDSGDDDEDDDDGDEEEEEESSAVKENPKKNSAQQKVKSRETKPQESTMVQPTNADESKEKSSIHKEISKLESDELRTSLDKDNASIAATQNESTFAAKQSNYTKVPTKRGNINESEKGTSLEGKSVESRNLSEDHNASRKEGAAPQPLNSTLLSEEKRRICANGEEECARRQEGKTSSSSSSAICKSSREKETSGAHLSEVAGNVDVDSSGERGSLSIAPVAHSPIMFPETFETLAPLQQRNLSTEERESRSNGSDTEACYKLKATLKETRLPESTTAMTSADTVFPESQLIERELNGGSDERRGDGDSANFVRQNGGPAVSASHQNGGATNATQQNAGVSSTMQHSGSSCIDTKQQNSDGAHTNSSSLHARPAESAQSIEAKNALAVENFIKQLKNIGEKQSALTMESQNEETKVLVEKIVVVPIDLNKVDELVIVSEKSKSQSPEVPCTSPYPERSDSLGSSCCNVSCTPSSEQNKTKTITDQHSGFTTARHEATSQNPLKSSGHGNNSMHSDKSFLFYNRWQHQKASAKNASEHSQRPVKRRREAKSIKARGRQQRMTKSLKTSAIGLNSSRLKRKSGLATSRRLKRRRLRRRSKRHRPPRNRKAVGEVPEAKSNWRRRSGRSLLSLQKDGFFGLHIRGGQNCSEARHWNDLNVSRYAQSAHCLRYDKLWYSVYQLDKPILEHAVSVAVYEKRKSPDGTTHWENLLAHSSIRLGTSTRSYRNQDGSISVTYHGATESSSGVRQSLDPQKDRLLVPSQTADASPKKSHEFLVVQDDLISKDGKECDKIGTGYEAFMNQPDKCSKPKGTCLRNQPLALWRRDKEASESGRPGCYFLSNFGVVAAEAIRSNVSGGGSGEVLALEYHSAHVFALKIEVRNGDSGAVSAGPFGRISHVYVDGTADDRTLLRIVIDNLGSSMAAFRVNVADCPKGLPGSWSRARGILQMILPRKDKRVSFDLQGRLPYEEFECTVELSDRIGRTLATRKMRVRKLERCYCVWQYECICTRNAKQSQSPTSSSTESSSYGTMSMEHYRPAGHPTTTPRSNVHSSSSSLRKYLCPALIGVSLFLFCLLFLLGLRYRVKKSSPRSGEKTKTESKESVAKERSLLRVNTYGEYGDSQLEAEDTSYVLQELKKSQASLRKYSQSNARQ